MSDQLLNAGPVEINMKLDEFVNLNKDSKHPNPWSPPTQYEQLFGLYNPYKIFRGQTTDLPQLKNALVDLPTSTRLAKSLFYGVTFGATLAAIDIRVWSNLTDTRSQAARAAYYLVPFAAMPVTYICSLDALHHTVSKETWTYWAAMSMPSMIYGVFRNSMASTLRVFIYGGIIACTYKFNCDHGGVLVNLDHYLLSNDVPRYAHLDPDQWKKKFNVPWLRDFDQPPSWKQWLDEDKKNDGPPN